MATIQVQFDIADQLCADILCTALEGGIGYWSSASDIKKSQGEDWQYVSAVLTDCEGDEDWKHVVDYAAIRLGIQRVLDPGFRVNQSIRAAVLSCALGPDNADYDAETADVIVQAACFNEIVYG